MIKKLVIFDLDGTLLDTSGDLCDAMNAMLEFYGFPHITVEQAKAYIGNGAKNFVIRSLPVGCEIPIEECLKKYNEIYNSSGSPKTALYDGIDVLLKNLKMDGAMLAIASNKPQPSMDEVYKRYLKQYDFDYVYGNRPCFAHKPDKECGEFILNELGVLPENAVVVGDGETDVRFAENLGCTGIAVTWGYRDKKVLTDAGAKIFADSASELYDIIKEFLNGELR